MVAQDSRIHLVTQRRLRFVQLLSHVPIKLWRLFVFVLLILLWWLMAVAVGQNFLPSPWQTFVAGLKMMGNGAVPYATIESLFVFLSGFLLAAAFGIPFGLLMGGVRVFGAAIEGYVNALSAMPRVAFIPVIIVFLGLGYQAKIFIVFVGAVMPIIINTYAGVLNCDGELIEMARSAGARDGQIFRKIMLPSALPYITAGLRIGASLALINTVVAELYTAVNGLGGLLSVYGNSFRMAPYFFVVCVLAAIGVAIMHILKLLERRMDRWRYRGEHL
jgi:ABC-type nitrate/sulfonate/bicarbonate transport system permease component